MTQQNSQHSYYNPDTPNQQKIFSESALLETRNYHIQFTYFLLWMIADAAQAYQKSQAWDYGW